MNILPEYEPIEREGESCESDVTSDECDSSDGEGPNESLLSCHISRALGSIPDLYFEFRWLTDELVYYGLRGKRGSYFDMAKLMYYSIFSSWIFRCSAKNCTQVKLWKGQARYFDTYRCGYELILIFYTCKLFLIEFSQQFNKKKQFNIWS